MIRHKIYVCRVREDPEKRVCLATQSYLDRFDVFLHGMWRQYFKHELEDIRLARVVAEEVGDGHPAERGG